MISHIDELNIHEPSNEYFENEIDSNSDQIMNDRF